MKQSDGTNELEFYYGTDGIVGFSLNGENFVYKKNLQGDIVGILDNAGKEIAKYVYDAWGNHKCYILSDNGEYIENCSETIYTDAEKEYNDIINLNPFRYRGYYYDIETKLYYLNSRYYDSEIGRFINADDVSVLTNTKDILNGLNLYAYCLNNPVNTDDENGNIPKWLKWLIGGLVIVGLTIATVVTGGASAGVAGFIIAGAFKGAVIGAVSGALVSGTIGGIISVVSNNGSWSDFWNGFSEGAADGFMSGAIIGGITGAISSSIQVANAAKAWGTAYDINGKVLRTPYKNMVHHYTEHVIKENMKGVAKNIVNYTKIGKNLWAQSANMAKLLPSGNLKIAFSKAIGSGGIYTTLGKILSIFLR